MQLGRSRQFYSNLDWSDHRFCAKKAYVCAVFAKIAYIKFELMLQQLSRSRLQPEVRSAKTCFRENPTTALGEKGAITAQVDLAFLWPHVIG